MVPFISFFRIMDHLANWPFVVILSKSCQALLIYTLKILFTGELISKYFNVMVETWWYINCPF